MHARNLLVVLFLVSSSSFLCMGSVAQAPFAAVNLTCEERMNISVESSTALSGSISCTVENPTAYMEKIEISIDSGEFAHSGPGSIYVGPDSSEDFDVVIQADQGISAQEHTVLVNATVTELSGLPPLNVASDEAAFILNILQYGSCSISSVSSFMEAKVGEEFSLEFEVYNLGNGEDVMDIGLTPASMERLQDLGFIASFPIESYSINQQDKPVRVLLNLKAPDSIPQSDFSEVDQISNIEVEVVVTSRISCESEYGCETDSTTSIVDLFGEDEPSENGILNSGEAGESMVIFGAGALATIVLLSLVYVFMKKS